jgi:hypothetical protein
MIFAFRNFFRNKTVNLTARSIRHFIPDAEIYCVSFYKRDPSEYDSQEPLLDFITEFRQQTKYVNPIDKPTDHEDTTQTSGYANPDNAKYFAEGYNAIWKTFRYTDDKVVMLAEDHFFTTGATLRELEENEFVLAYAPWDHPSELDANGSILCMNLMHLDSLFPIPEEGHMIEHRIWHSVVNNVREDRRYKIKNRRRIDYHGDGMYTNSSVEIENELKKAGIL